MDKVLLTHEQCICAAERLADSFSHPRDGVKVFGVPRGGVPVAYLVYPVLNRITRCEIVEQACSANLIVDDIIDSGATKDYYGKAYDTLFLALADFVKPKIERRDSGRWVVFPWEQGKEDTSGDDIATRLLQYIGEDVTREGLKETPQRFLKAWKELTSGYGVDPKSVIKSFTDGAERYDEMIVVRDLPFFSICEHHMIPFFGTATIAYIPDKRILGLSKFGRLLEIFSRRLQVQERLTVQIADALQEPLGPKGIGVLIKARHLCMESRGYTRQGHETITSALRGKFMEDAKVRAEFMSLADSRG